MLKVYCGFQNTPLANYIEEKDQKQWACNLTNIPMWVMLLSASMFTLPLYYMESFFKMHLWREKKQYARATQPLVRSFLSLTRVQPDYLYLPQAASTHEQNERQTPTKPSVLWDWSSPDQIHPTVESHLHD